MRRDDQADEPAIVPPAEAAPDASQEVRVTVSPPFPYPHPSYAQADDPTPENKLAETAAAQQPTAAVTAAQLALVSDGRDEVCSLVHVSHFIYS